MEGTRMSPVVHLSSSSSAEDDSPGATTDAKDVLEIPPEILQNIFTFVSKEDLLNLRLTCTYFREQASHPSVLSLDLMDQTYTLEEFWHLTMTVGQLMPNVATLQLTGKGSESVPGEFLVVVKESCVRLKNLSLENCRMKGGASIGNLPETLSVVALSDVKFEDPDLFFAPTACAKFTQSLSELSIRDSNAGSSSVLKGIAAFSNLQSLCLEKLPNLMDENFAQLDGHLPNLTELYLVNLPIGDKAFRTIANSFRKLEQLIVKKCARVRDDAFSALKDNLQLEKLVVDECSITDAGVKPVLDRLLNLKHLSFRLCVLGDRTMLSICQGLPYLEYLNIYATIPGITDMGFPSVIEHSHLTDLFLVGVMVSDVGIAQLVPAVPNLKRLHLMSCGITDVGFQLITESLHGLEKLTLNETIITDDGLTRNAPKLSSVNHLEIDSLHFTENAVIPIVDFLGKIQIVDILFVENEGGLHVHRFPPYNQVKLKKFTSPAFATKIVPAFLDAGLLSLSDIELTTSDVDCIDECHPHLEIFYSYDGRMTDDVALAIISKFRALKELHIYNTVVTDVTFQRLEERREERSLQCLSIESDYFPSEETVVTVIPILSAMEQVDICTVDMKNQISITARGGKKLTVAGRHVTDSVLLALVSHIKGVVELVVSNVSITHEGFRRVAAHLTELVSCELDLSLPEAESALTGDEAVSVLGELVTSELKVLSIKGETLTDAGLPLLGHQLESLTKLKVIRSSVTLNGIKSMGTQLGKIGDVVFSGHLHLLNAVAGDGISIRDEEEV